MLWRSEAIDRIEELRQRALASQPIETVPLDSVSQRALACDLVSERNVPEQDHATMDGYAFDATNDYPLSVVDEEVFPESESPSLAAGEAVRIATGAPLPERANAVLKREDATVNDGQLTGPSIRPGTYVYKQGSNVSAGERLFDAGETLSPKDAILLGDLGIDSVDVRVPFSVGVLATGTEIHENRTRDLDSAMLAGLVRSWRHQATYEGTVPDDYGQVRDRIEALTKDHDVLVTTGGTSVGHKDYTVRALEELGEVLFHRVRLRPGKPIAAAQLPDAVAFAIPGKPIGAHTITTLVARSFFVEERSLATVKAILETDVALGPEGFEYAIPVSIDGETAVPLGHVDSPLPIYEDTFDPSVVSSSTRTTRADGFVLTESALAEGTTIDVTPYHVVE